ncbi:MAG: hypothetical protein LBJ84_00905, partial [Oscillospiraceae bacterium]|nr:hypothetical protein [Oscillospiraceae bacterium]
SGVEKPPPKPQEPPDVRRVTIAEAADRMGKSQQFVRVLLQSGKADFGFAVKGSAGTYSYHISPKKFSEYIGDAPGAGGLVFDH